MMFIPSLRVISFSKVPSWFTLTGELLISRDESESVFPFTVRYCDVVVWSFRGCVICNLGGLWKLYICIPMYPITRRRKIVTEREMKNLGVRKDFLNLNRGLLLVLESTFLTVGLLLLKRARIFVESRSRYCAYIFMNPVKNTSESNFQKSLFSIYLRKRI